ncbi:ABC transporter permease [Specibacter sp. RAF43]|uniref:ABC transporter permease n=1 Tax=Specibacter sp. RAF43 TaxID=3233057 RepID=UPI003F97E085
MNQLGTYQRVTKFLIENPLLVLLIVMVGAIQIATGSQLTWMNLRGIFLDGAIIAIVAVPCAMLIIAGYIDLSVGSTLALGGVVAGKIMAGGGNAGVAILAAVAVGVVVGFVNAIVTTRFGLSAFITTLGMLTAVRGVAQLVSPLPVNTFGSAFGFLGVGNIAGIPVAVWIAGLCLVAAAVFLTLTPSGRHVYALGVNKEAAYLSGINIKRLPFVLYMFSGGAAGLAGAVTVARLNSAPAGQLGIGFELTVLTAVLLGGVALTGGEGNMFGVIVGVLFLGFLNNGLTLLGVTTFWQNVASGIALIAAIGIAALTSGVRHKFVRPDKQVAAVPPQNELVAALPTMPPQ